MIFENFYLTGNRTRMYFYCDLRKTVKKIIEKIKLTCVPEQCFCNSEKSNNRVLTILKESLFYKNIFIQLHKPLR